MGKSRSGAKAKLKEFFLSRLGKVVDSKTLQEVADGSSEWGRRVRELRQHDGMDIQTHNDDSTLKPGQYRLASLKVLPKSANVISKEIRAFVLDRDGHMCRMCGIEAGEPHPDDNGRKARMHIGHVIDLSLGGTSDPENLQTLCSVCNEGAANQTLPRPDSDKLKAQIKRAPGKDQREVLRWLIEKYRTEVPAMILGHDKKG